MNKSKIIIPLAAALLTLTSCGGVKTKKVKTIWGNTWKYTNTVHVGFEINDRQYIQEHENDIDWESTRITFLNVNDKYQKADQNVDKIFSAEFIRTCDAEKYPNIAKQRNFFSKNKIVVSKKEDATVTIGGTKYDANEANGNETISFNNDAGSLQSFCDNDGIIEQLNVKHEIDEYTFSNTFTINVFFNSENGSTKEVRYGKGYFEIAALA